MTSRSEFMCLNIDPELVRWGEKWGENDSSLEKNLENYRQDPPIQQPVVELEKKNLMFCTFFKNRKSICEFECNVFNLKINKYIRKVRHAFSGFLFFLVCSSFPPLGSMFITFKCLIGMDLESVKDHRNKKLELCTIKTCAPLIKRIK